MKLPTRMTTIALLLCLMACGQSDGAETSEAATEGEVPTYEVGEWPQMPNNWVMGLASGLTTDNQDHIWLIHRPRTVPEGERERAAPAVLEFDAAGNFIQGWGGPDFVASTEFEWPNTEHGIAVDDDGFVWIAGSGNGDHQILKFTRTGEFVLQIGRAGASQGNTDTQNLDRPADIFVHEPTNEVFVADGYGNRRVIVFDAETGAFKRMWGAYGNPPTDPAPGEAEWDPQHFNLVHGVRVASDGLVYVSDSQAMRLQVFTTDGRFVSEKQLGRYPDPDPALLASLANDSTFGTPTVDLLRELAGAHRTVNRSALSSDPEQRWVFIGERSDQQVVVLDRQTLEEVTRFGGVGDQLGEFYVLHDMTTDAAGNLYTAEVNNLGGTRKRVQKFTYTGMAPASGP